MSFVFLAIAAIALQLGVLAVRRRPLPGPWWAPAMASAELAPWILVGIALTTAGSWVAGWVAGAPGRSGLVVMAVASALFAVSVRRSLRARREIEAGVVGLVGPSISLPRIRWRALLRPYPPLPGPFEVTSFSYGPHERHVVDRIARAGVESAPVLIHVHGGGWWRGKRGRQARPLIHRMASQGWVVLTPSYRLSPEATFPDHLDDIERLLRWVRDPAEPGVSTGFVAVAGGSAGGQLAALAGMGDVAPDLTIPIYGVHDLLGADDISAKWPYLRTQVLKSDPVDDRDAWVRASPARRATARRSPFLVVHGAADWVVDAAESRDLVSALRDAGGPPVGHIEVPFANHGFDFFASIRGLTLAEGIAAALESVRADASQEKA